LSNREGIDNWRLVPSKLRGSLGREIAPVRSLLSLQTQTVDWNHWWHKSALAKTSKPRLTFIRWTPD
jgi:hypothetical protein